MTTPRSELVGMTAERLKEIEAEHVRLERRYTFAPGALAKEIHDVRAELLSEVTRRGEESRELKSNLDTAVANWNLVMDERDRLRALADGMAGALENPEAIETVAGAIWAAYQNGSSIREEMRGISWASVVEQRGTNRAAAAWYSDAVAEARAAITALSTYNSDKEGK